MLKTLQCFLWAVGIFCIAYWTEVSLKAKLRQTRAMHELERRELATKVLASGDIVGWLEIPRLNLSTVIFEGADQDVLERGAGHLPGSAFPGSQGNAVLAAHRDTFFRPLREIRPGDAVQIHQGRRDTVYIVQSARVVEPEDVEVLQPTPQPSLTLITCYPFRFIGPAPQRYVVRATLAP